MTRLLRSLLKTLAPDDGQTIVAGAFAIIAVLGVAGVTLDVGAAWTQRRSLQNTADAAALAGAQLLNGTSAGETAARAAATDYVNQNTSGLNAAPTISFADGSTKITVTVTKTSPSIVSGAFGVGDSVISAKAAAKIRSQNLPGKGVVPIGVEKTDWESRTSGNMLMKDSPPGSNTGLVNLLGDNGDHIRDGLKFGSGVALQPTLNTEPGNKLGQATQNPNSGLRVRLARALTHLRPDNGSKHCYTWADVQPPSSGVWHCSPFSATENDGVQATAVILVPIIVEDFTLLNGTKTINVYKDGNVYMLAYFWIDGNATYENPATGDWDSATNPKGAIWGRFIDNVPTQLTVFDPAQCRPSDGCSVVDFDKDSIFKVIELVE